MRNERRMWRAAAAEIGVAYFWCPIRATTRPPGYTCGRPGAYFIVWSILRWMLFLGERDVQRGVSTSFIRIKYTQILQYEGSLKSELINATQLQVQNVAIDHRHRAMVGPDSRSGRRQ